MSENAKSFTVAEADINGRVRFTKKQCGDYIINLGREDEFPRPVDYFDGRGMVSLSFPRRYIAALLDEEMEENENYPLNQRKLSPVEARQLSGVVRDINRMWFFKDSSENRRISESTKRLSAEAAGELEQEIKKLMSELNSKFTMDLLDQWSAELAREEHLSQNPDPEGVVTVADFESSSGSSLGEVDDGAGEVDSSITGGDGSVDRQKIRKSHFIGSGDRKTRSIKKTPHLKE